MNCTYHPIYRECRACGLAMQRDEVRECPGIAALIEKVGTPDWDNDPDQLLNDGDPGEP
jgi:hypothetical protein